MAAATLSFGLGSEIACKDLDADVYARVYRLTGRGMILPLPPTLVPIRQALDSHGSRLRPTADRNALQKYYSDIAVDRVAMMAWYRHCPHPEAGIKQVERIAVHVIRHAGSSILEVKRSVSPETNEFDIGKLHSTNTATGGLWATIYPTLPDEQMDHPITEVLEIPWRKGGYGEGYVALRGIEKIIDAQKLMPGRHAQT